MKYPILIHKDPKSDYGVTIPGSRGDILLNYSAKMPKMADVVTGAAGNIIIFDATPKRCISFLKKCLKLFV
jgi:hypothetical protein